MNIIINRQTLSNALAEVAPLAGTCKALPLYDNVKFKTKGNRIRLQTTDTENTIRKYVEAVSIDVEGEFLVDCKSLGNYLKALRDDNVELNMESGQLTIKHKKGTASFPTKDTEQFFEPEVLLPDSHVFTMPSHLLAEAIENGIKFTSANDYRPILRCVYAYIECGKFGYCASDTHRLITNETPLGEDYENCNWVISPNTAPIIAKACHNVDNVEITDTSKITVYKLDTTIIYSAKAAGKFPDAKRIIPKDNTITCEVAKSDLTEAIKRILLVAPTENNLIKLVITDGEMRIMADNYARGKSATESVSATSTADITIGFDASKLLDCINAAEDDMVKITFRDASRPILIVDEQNPFKNILLMPMSLN